MERTLQNREPLVRSDGGRGGPWSGRSITAETRRSSYSAGIVAPPRVHDTDLIQTTYVCEPDPCAFVKLLTVVRNCRTYT